MSKKKFIAGIILTTCLTLTAGAQVYSQLWGKRGELWDRARIPDFTTAGYRSGTAPIPEYPALIAVTQFGAIGDGKTDNTAAFRRAIRACQKKQTVYIPEGTFLLSDTLLIGKSNISIKGSGSRTCLRFSKGLEELYADYNVHYKNQTKWSWSGAMILFAGAISDCGIENLTIEFPDSLWKGHDFHEKGYNGLGFSNGAHNGWVRNVIIKNADLGIWVEGSSHHITAENWILEFGPNRQLQKVSGHHGVNIYGGHNLLQNFAIRGRYQHDLSVESAQSIFNVFRSGSGKDLCIDHHNHAQSFNLFTNLDAGIGSRLYASGGNDTPRGICTRETFWNIRAAKPMLYCNQYDAGSAHSIGNVCIGIKTILPSIIVDAYNNWFETIEPEKLYPADLYEAQVQLKGIR